MKTFKAYLTATENSKGVLDVDAVKGCTLGMKAHPEGGCYGECYANKIAIQYGFDFSKSIHNANQELKNNKIRMLKA